MWVGALSATAVVTGMEPALWIACLDRLGCSQNQSRANHSPKYYDVVHTEDPLASAVGRLSLRGPSAACPVLQPVGALFTEEQILPAESWF